MSSLRQEMLARLRTGPVTLRDLAREFRLSERDAAEHLDHALRSLAPGERLVEEPARCLGCDFAFRKRARRTSPSRCPRCRSERIAPARFAVEPAGRRGA